MVRFRNLIALGHPDDATCNRCGEGQLRFGVVRGPGASTPKYALQCAACPFTEAV